MSQQNIRFIQEYHPSIDDKENKAYCGLNLSNNMKYMIASFYH